jgi:hypothetical protein
LATPPSTRLSFPPPSLSDFSSPACTSVVLQDTNALLANSPILAFKPSKLGVTHIPSNKPPPHIRADDMALVSLDEGALQALVRLSEDFTSSHNLKMVSDKTHLLLFIPRCRHPSPLKPSTSALSMTPPSATPLPGQDTGPHQVIPTGLARHHSGNVAAAIRAHKVFATPVFFSWLVSPVLSAKDVNIPDRHHKVTQQRFLKLPASTPRAAIHFISATLPASVILHKRQLGLLGMIARLGRPTNLPHRHVLHALLHSCKGSWFTQLRYIATQYSLPDPAATLQSP